MDFGPRRRAVAVIGDGAIATDSPRYSLAMEVGRGLCDRGFSVVTGGLGGVMEAASRGARQSEAWSFGAVIAILPGLDRGAANRYADVIVPTGLGHSRNALVAQADAVVAIGGGAGTLSEMCFAWMFDRLLVALRVDGWSGELADRRLDGRVRYPELPDDRVYGARDATEAVALIDTHIELYRGRR